MRVKCVICDTISVIDSESPEAKKLRNRPIHTFMCSPCNIRISTKTEDRISTGQFRLYRDKKTNDEW